MKSINDFPVALEKILASLELPVKDYVAREDRIDGLTHIQEALASAGHYISLSQSEELWGEFSYNKYASWLELPSSIKEAELAILEFCDDIENGENHSGL